MRNNDWVGKRSSMRQNCQMRAEMRFLDGRPPGECTIVDISASGCRIELETGEEVPEDFDLFIPSRSELKIAKVRRQDGQRLGVAFLKSRLDDPLVMQTLLERVARLERGYTEVKAVVGADGLKPVGIAAAAASPLVPPVESGPLVEHRLKALGDGLQELRVTVDKLASAPTQASVDLVTDRANESAAEIAGLKDQIASLAGAMRGMSVSAQDEKPDQSGEIAAMKGEMTKLSVALRNLVEQMPKSVALSQAARGDAGPSGAENMQMAKMKADIAQLRAALEVQQGGAAVVALAKQEEVAALKSEIAQLRETMASAAHAEPTRVVAIAEDVAALKREMAALGETLRETTSRAFAESPNYSADLAHMKAEMLKLSISMREMAAELPSVRFASETIATAGPEAIEWTKVNVEMAQLRAAMTKGLADLRANLKELAATTTAHAEPTRVVAIAQDVAALKQEMAALGETMRDVTSRAFAESPNFSADLAHMKAEMLKLSISMREMAAELPSLRTAVSSSGNAEADPAQIAKFSSAVAQMRAEIEARLNEATQSTRQEHKDEIAKVRTEFASLRADLDELGEAFDSIGLDAGGTTTLVTDVAGLKTEMSRLGETLREITGKAYADAPAFSADLAHMKAEMLQLSHSMKEMAAELPSVRFVGEAIATAGPEAVQWAKVNSDIAQLRAAITKDLTDLRGGMDELEQITAEIANDPGRSKMLVNDVSGLKNDMASLAETLRGVTSQAYTAAPNFSADLAHMKAEMLKLSISMKDMAAEMPKTALMDAPARPAIVDAEQIEKINGEIARLKTMIDERRSDAGVNAAHEEQLARLRAEVAQLREVSRLPATASSMVSSQADLTEISDLRASVQTLILLVSQSFSRREAA